MEEYVVLVTGSRDWTDEACIREALQKVVMPDRAMVLVHGACHLGGADMIADGIARELGWTVHPYPADWEKWGKAAGPIRNNTMVKHARPHVVLAFPKAGSRGTTHCIRVAREYAKQTDSRLEVLRIYRDPPETKLGS